MATKEELFKAVRLLKQHYADHGPCVRPQKCQLRRVCNSTEFNFGDRIEAWPDPEGGGEDG